MHTSCSKLSQNRGRHANFLLQGNRSCDLLEVQSEISMLYIYAGMVRSSNGTLAAALAIFVSAGLAFPYFITRKQRVSHGGPDILMHLLPIHQKQQNTMLAHTATVHRFFVRLAKTMHKHPPSTSRGTVPHQLRAAWSPINSQTP
jgi:hypothetical protein